MVYDRVLGPPRRVLTTALLLVATLTGLLVPSVQGSQQAPSGTVSIDAPAAGAMAVLGVPSSIGGWAVREAGSGTGVQQVDVYLDGPAGAGTYLGTARYGIPRRDVAAAFSRPDWTNSGFAFEWMPRAIGSGAHVLYVVAQGAGGPPISSSVTVSVSETYGSYCTMVRPCYLYRNSLGWELDYGGPGTHFEYFPDTRR